MTMQGASRPLSAAAILDLWERGAARHPVERDLLTLAAASPGASVAELAQLSIGQRDALLLAVRERTFGPRLAGFARCPSCDSPLEFNLRVADLTNGAGAACPATELTEQADGITVRFRLPTSLDLLSLASDRAPGAAGQRLLERCVLEVDGTAPHDAQQRLPDTLRRRIAERMAAADPLAEILFDLACPDCGERWQQLFDPGAFLWAELAARARRLLAEVHALARAYGWREADILALSSQRRRWYLEMVEA